MFVFFSVFFRVLLKSEATNAGETSPAWTTTTRCVTQTVSVVDILFVCHVSLQSVSCYWVSLLQDMEWMIILCSYKLIKLTNLVISRWALLSVLPDIWGIFSFLFEAFMKSAQISERWEARCNKEKLSNSPIFTSTFAAFHWKESHNYMQAVAFDCFHWLFYRIIVFL